MYASGTTAVQSQHQKATAVWTGDGTRQLLKAPSSSCTAFLGVGENFGPLAAPSPFHSLNWAVYLFQGTGTASFNKAKKFVYYQAIEPL